MTLKLYAIILNGPCLRSPPWSAPSPLPPVLWPCSSSCRAHEAIGDYRRHQLARRRQPHLLGLDSLLEEIVSWSAISNSAAYS
jgi:hypothetical protein